MTLDICTFFRSVLMANLSFCLIKPFPTFPISVYRAQQDYFSLLLNLNLTKLKFKFLLFLLFFFPYSPSSSPSAPFPPSSPLSPFLSLTTVSFPSFFSRWLLIKNIVKNIVRAMFLSGDWGFCFMEAFIFGSEFCKVHRWVNILLSYLQVLATFD